MKKHITSFWWILLLLCFLLPAFASCGENGQDGKDGKDGADAEVTIGEDGELFVNGEDTWVAGVRADATVSVRVQGEEYGRVVGGGRFAEGETVALRAIPAAGAFFAGWQDEAGATVGTEPLLLFPAAKGTRTLTAVFEKSVIGVSFKISENTVRNFFRDGVAFTVNGVPCTLQRESTENGGYQLISPVPLTFSYGEEVCLSVFGMPGGNDVQPCWYDLTEEEFCPGGSADFSGGKLPCAKAYRYTFRMTENRKYYFYFDVKTFSAAEEPTPRVSLAADHPEYGSVTGDTPQKPGDPVTVRATAKVSDSIDYIYAFAGWYEGDRLLCDDPEYTFIAKNPTTN